VNKFAGVHLSDILVVSKGKELLHRGSNRDQDIHSDGCWGKELDKVGVDHMKFHPGEESCFFAFVPQDYNQQTLSILLPRD